LISYSLRRGSTFLEKPLSTLVIQIHSSPSSAPAPVTVSVIPVRVITSPCTCDYLSLDLKTPVPGGHPKTLSHQSCACVCAQKTV